MYTVVAYPHRVLRPPARMPAGSSRCHADPAVEQQPRDGRPHHDARQQGAGQARSPVEGDLAQQRADERQQAELEDQRAEGDGRVERGTHAGGAGSCHASRYIRWIRRERLTPDITSSSTLSTTDARLARRREHGLHGRRRVAGQGELAHDAVGDGGVVLGGQQRRGEDDEGDQCRERLGGDDRGAVDALDGEEAAQAATREPLLVHHVRQPHRLSSSFRGRRVPGTARARHARAVAEPCARPTRPSLRTPSPARLISRG